MGRLRLRRADQSPRLNLVVVVLVIIVGSLMDVTDPQHSAAAAVVFAHKARRGTALISLPNESRTCQMLEKEEHVREGEYDGVRDAPTQTRTSAESGRPLLVRAQEEVRSLLCLCLLFLAPRPGRSLVSSLSHSCVLVCGVLLSRPLMMWSGPTPLDSFPRKKRIWLNLRYDVGFEEGNQTGR